MSRFILRRLILIPILLLLVNFLGYSYAHLVLPGRLARTPYVGPPPETGPLLPAYLEYLGGALQFDLGATPVGRERLTLTEEVGNAFSASLGLLGLALPLSVLLGLPLGMLAARHEPRGIARWFTFLSAAGLAMPGFYVGNLLILAVLAFVLLRITGTRAPIPVYGFGWDLHLVLPVLALITRPIVQIAQLTAGMLTDELGKRYVVTARSIGYPWRMIRWRHVLRNALSSITGAVAGSTRLLMAELIVIEWLFGWPGLGRLLARTLIPPAVTSQVESMPLFLNPTVVATVLTAFAAFFLVVDLASAIIARIADPRLRATEEEISSVSAAPSQVALPGRNWHLLLGGVLVVLMVVAAAAGPALAPQDPLEEHPIVRSGEGWEKPPLAPFTIPGFPLGSDHYGRDTLSRLLWGIHPTLIVVVFVALVRLVLGTAIGLAAGWSSDRSARILDVGVAGVLAVPVLIVALVVIAAVGIETGILAFILGLAVTGWGETARLVREQTQLIKGQQHIEAARALGGSDVVILLRHVLPHVLPMVWMLLALEISATLITAAGLAFLGYYLGGDIWLTVDDRIARRLSGTPELGQLLAENSGITVVLSNPWPMIIAATVVFLIVLSFNLLGEGLRRHLGLERGKGETRLSRTLRGAGWWWEEQVWRPLSSWVRRRPLPAAAAGLAVLIVVAGLVTWRVVAARAPVEPAASLEVPGGHLWTGALHDPYGTLRTTAIGPRNAGVLWTFRDPTGFFSGPAVAADGTIYVTSRQGLLSALTPEGQVLWQVQMPARPAGTPALGPTGDIYLSDFDGALSAFAPQGELRWRFVPADYSGRASAPTVGPDGTIYYLLADRLQAVRPDGTLLWESSIPPQYRGGLPRLDPTGEWLFWNTDGVIDLRDGSLLDLRAPLASSWYFTGADGRLYLVAGNTVAQWRAGDAGVEIVRSVSLDVKRIGLPSGALPDGMQVTPGQHVWTYYGWNWGTVRIVWLDLDGRIHGTVIYRLANSSAIGMDGEDTIYSCGFTSENLAQAQPICMAFSPGSEDPLWELALERTEPLNDIILFAGGAVVPGRLYITTVDGFFYAIGEQP